MPVATPTQAARQLHLIAAACKKTGTGGMKLALVRDLRVQAAPLVTAVRESARRNLPQTGGLAETQARQSIRVSVLTSARNAGVRIRTRTLGSFQTNAGYVRHPVFGDRERWVQQDLPRAAGWWDRPLHAAGPAVTANVIASIDRVNAQIRLL